MMIRIERPTKVPLSLTKSGNRQTEDDCAAYDGCPNDYNSGVKKFPLKSFYSAKPVKNLLVEMHRGKCCYCEKRYPPEYLHVEHFRPKGGVRQDFDQKKDEFPGYYWLAYRWDNLLLACHACNTTHKRTFFPLANPAKRARSHHDDVTEEEVLFVDPVGLDPRLHITFEDETPKGHTSEGRKTIEGIGLKRPKLNEDRLEKLGHINVRLWFLEAAATYPTDAHLQTKVEEAGRYIESAKRPEAEFSSMVTDYLERLGL